MYFLALRQIDSIDWLLKKFMLRGIFTVTNFCTHNPSDQFSKSHYQRVILKESFIVI